MKKYTLKQDHADIKKQIKEWEVSMDWIVDCLLNIKAKYGDEIVVNEDGEGEEVKLSELIEETESMSHEMTAINL